MRAGNDCKKLSGSAYTTNVIIDDAEAELTGEFKTFTSKADSGNDGKFFGYVLSLKLPESSPRGDAMNA